MNSRITAQPGGCARDQVLELRERAPHVPRLDLLAQDRQHGGAVERPERLDARREPALELVLAAGRLGSSRGRSPMDERRCLELEIRCYESLTNAIEEVEALAACATPVT